MTLQEIVNNYDSFDAIPASYLPTDSKELEKVKKQFEKGKKKMSAFTGAQKNAERNMSSGTTNDKGDSSIAGNKPVKDIIKKIDETALQPKTEESERRVKELRAAASEALKQMEGKNEEEQKKIVSDVLSEEKPAIPLPKVEKEAEPALKKTAENIEQAERDKEIDSKSSAFLKSWASTHPSWLKILSSKDLSWGQKVALVGSALANIGANVTLGAKAGFERSGFYGVPWDFKRAIDKYTENELDTVLKGDQNRRTQVDAGEFWANFRKEHGDKVADELIALGDLYGNNPETLRNRLASMGVYKSADEVKDLYANLEKTKISEEAKRELLETEAKRLENEIKELQKKVSKETAEELIKAQNELNKFNALKSSSDSATYNLEKGAGYIKNAIEVVEGAVSTVGGVMTGGVVGRIPSSKDGIIKARGIPQKIVRADGSEVQLDPNDNIYATKNTLTTEKDDGSELVHMSQDDRVLVLQNRLGYSGGFINKDFNYYLSKLRG